MTSRTDINPITGDKLQTKPSTKEYRDNFDTIFRQSAEFNIEKEIKKQTKAALEMLDIKQECCGGCKGDSCKP